MTKKRDHLRVRVEPLIKQRFNEIGEQQGYTSETQHLRQVIRHYLDHQEDVVGSRRHFNMTLKRELGQLRASIEYMILTQIIASMQSTNMLLEALGHDTLTLEEYLDNVFAELDGNEIALHGFLTEQSTKIMSNIIKKRQSSRQ